MELNYITPKSEQMAMDSGEILTLSVVFIPSENETDKDSVAV